MQIVQRRSSDTLNWVLRVGLGEAGESGETGEGVRGRLWGFGGKSGSSSSSLWEESEKVASSDSLSASLGYSALSIPTERRGAGYLRIQWLAGEVER